MWKNFEKKRMDISVAVHKKGTKSRANIEIRASSPSTILLLLIKKNCGDDERKNNLI